MTALLTWNGIPPQIIGSLPKEQRQAVISYASINKAESYQDWQNSVTIPSALHSFAKTIAAVSESFTRWGAVINNSRGWNKIGFNSSYLQTGDVTYPTDSNLHSDAENALSNLQNKNFLILRILCVSSRPAIFVDLTRKEDMGALLNQYRINDSRIYNPNLLALAQARREVVNPQSWDIVAFDAATPHNPQVALQAGQRILADAWIEMDLASNWRTRVKCGDAPKLRLSAPFAPN